MIRRTLTRKNYNNITALTNIPQLFFSSYNRPSPKFLVPDLPILEEMAQRVKQNDFPSLEDTVIIGVQHILPTTASMFDIIINSFGVSPSDIFLAGKFYSSCPPIESYMRKKGIHLMRNKIPKRPGQFEEFMNETVSDMWELVAEHLQTKKKNRVIIFDEGAHCLESMPRWIRYRHAFSSLEQTRFGFYTSTIGTQLFPLIDVACSAAKKRLESPLISKAVIKRIKETLPRLSVDENTIFGVVGNGAIGSAIVEYLLSSGYDVVIYDGNENAFHNIHHHKCFRVDSIEKVIAGSNIIFGCTGRDISKGLDFLKLVKAKTTLISTSSQDIEFRELLKACDKIYFTKSEDGVLSSINFPSASGAEITVLESGFPVNFDRTPTSDPTEDMELTRGLLLGAFIQAVTTAQKPIKDGATLNKDSHLMLDPYLQQFVAHRWLKRQQHHPHALEKTDCFDDIEWIVKNSNGKYEENRLLAQSFGKDISHDKTDSSTPSLRR